MNDNVKITVLGCGNSTGVPAIGNYWGACDPNEPKNTRTRSSIMVESNDTRLIIDTGPDFKQQLNRENVSNIDAVLYTHQHSDHVMGIDELRVLKFRNQKDLIPIYANDVTIDELSRRFHYLFDGGDHTIYPPVLLSNIIQKSDFGTKMCIDDIEFIPFEQDHGSCNTIGYRFGSVAYSLDMLTLNEAAIDTLIGIETWIVDCAAYKDKNVVHANIDTIYELNNKIGAKNVYLSSLSLSTDYLTFKNELKNGYNPCWDGMIIP